MIFQMFGDNLELLGIRNIYEKLREKNPDVYSIADPGVWIDMALKEFVKFIATYLDDKVTFVAYLYKLLFV